MPAMPLILPAHLAVLALAALLAACGKTETTATEIPVIYQTVAAYING